MKNQLSAAALTILVLYVGMPLYFGIANAYDMTSWQFWVAFFCVAFPCTTLTLAAFKNWLTPSPSKDK